MSCANWSGAERSSKIFVRTGAERSSKIYVSSGAERSGAETKLTSLSVFFECLKYKGPYALTTY